VQAGQTTKDEVFVEFCKSFGDKRNDGRITRDEWNDYYAAVSATIESDEMFCSLMRQAWCC
jgi:hypothetical protein